MKDNIEVDVKTMEEAWFLNFKNINKDLYDFAAEVYNCSSKLIDHFREKNDGLYCNFSILFLTKSSRLFRASSFLIEKGYFIEAMLLFRSFIELDWCLSYILNDKSGKRLKKWMETEDPKSRWDINCLLSIYGDKEVFKESYKRLSLYTHTHILGMNEFVELESDNLLNVITGPMCGEDNFMKSAEIFKQVAMQCGATCELIGNNFVDSKTWDKLYKPIKNHKVYKDSINSIPDETKEKVMNMIKEINNEI